MKQLLATAVGVFLSTTVVAQEAITIERVDVVETSEEPRRIEIRMEATADEGSTEEAVVELKLELNGEKFDIVINESELNDPESIDDLLNTLPVEIRELVTVELDGLAETITIDADVQWDGEQRQERVIKWVSEDGAEHEVVNVDGSQEHVFVALSGSSSAETIIQLIELSNLSGEEIAAVIDALEAKM